MGGVATNEKVNSLENPEVILQVRDLVKYFPVRMGFWQSMRTKEQPVLRAVDGVSLDVYKGEILGLVGESGCGKTTLARTILRLTDATGGEAVLEGEDIFGLDEKEMNKLRRKMQIIFQDPYESMNPRMDVRQSYPNLWFCRGLRSLYDSRDAVASALADVEMVPPEEYGQVSP